MTRRRRQLLHIGALALTVIAVGALPSYGQSNTSPTPPPTQDTTLRTTLGLGNAAGCLPLLGIASNDPDANDKLLTALNSPNSGLGNELRAICGPSAVTSSSALGGGMQSLQPVKTVTQFRLARSRIDQRLTSKPKPAPPRKPSKDANDSWVQAQQPLNPTAGLGPRSGAGVFGEVDFNTRNRADTLYESGYESDVSGFSLGADYAGGGATVGGWFGRTKQDGNFTRFSPLFATTGGDTAQNAAVLSDPAVFTKVCGGLSTGGTFEQTANQFGGFAGFGGARGFVDGTFAWTSRDHEYARNVCTIETQGLVSYNAATGVLTDSVHPQGVDDIFAGTLSGVSQIDETSFSVRAGGDAGNAAVSGGPRVIFTVTHAKTGAYVETGRNTVANTVTFNGGTTIPRTLGGPIGTELAFDEQTRTSVLLEAGGEFAVHAGAVSPFFAGYWRHEFNGDFPLVTARMAQDQRSNPFVLGFGFDAYDRDAFRFGVGANAIAGDRFVVRAEYTRLVADAIFSGRTFSVQARVRF